MKGLRDGIGARWIDDCIAFVFYHRSRRHSLDYREVRRRCDDTFQSESGGLEQRFVFRGRALATPGYRKHDDIEHLAEVRAGRFRDKRFDNKQARTRGCSTTYCAENSCGVLVRPVVDDFHEYVRVGLRKRVPEEITWRQSQPGRCGTRRFTDNPRKIAENAVC